MLWKDTKEDTISYLKYDYVRKEHLIRMNNSNILKGEKTDCVHIVRTHIIHLLFAHIIIYIFYISEIVLNILF